MVDRSFLVKSRSVLGCITSKQPQCNEDATVRWWLTVTKKEPLRNGRKTVSY